jgi:hypothetical protein
MLYEKRKKGDFFHLSKTGLHSLGVSVTLNFGLSEVVLLHCGLREGILKDSPRDGILEDQCRTNRASVSI